MVELKTIRNFSKESKEILLQEFGYDTDGIFVLNASGEKVLDRYTERSIKLNNFVILPGSTIILDDNPFSIISYIEEFGDVFGE